MIILCRRFLRTPLTIYDDDDDESSRHYKVSEPLSSFDQPHALMTCLRVIRTGRQLYLGEIFYQRSYAYKLYVEIQLYLGQSVNFGPSDSVQDLF